MTRPLELIPLVTAMWLAPALLACASEDAASTGTGGASSGGAAPTARVGGAGGAGGGAASELVERLVAHLTGRFDSVAQAASNPSYFEIQLETCAVSAPELGEHVLYVEQAVIGSLEAPYRQRLYVVSESAEPVTDVQTTVYELVDPDAFIGRCADPSPVVLAVEATEREGCGVHLTWMTDHFEGGTVGNGCSSSLQGASYATSEVTTREDRIESWDRGYDRADMQVWGAVAGAYVFDRKTPYGEQP